MAHIVPILLQDPEHGKYVPRDTAQRRQTVQNNGHDEDFTDMKVTQYHRTGVSDCN